MELQNPEAPLSVPPSLPSPRSNWRADFPERVEAVTAALSHLGLALPTPAAISQGAGALRWTHRLYDVSLPKPEAGKLDQQFETVRRAAAGVSVQTSQDADGAKVQIGVDGLLTHTLTMHWLGHPARAAIIVDNLGSDLLVARALAGIEAPITFAIRPAQPFSKEVGELARLFGREVLLQLPDETDHPPAAVVAPTTGKDRAELVRWFDHSLDTVPHAVGVSSEAHQAFTGDAERLQWMLNIAKDKHLFVVNHGGGTAGAGVCTAAAGSTVACADGQTVLDAVGNAVSTQIDDIVRAARTQGDAIAVLHASQETVAAVQMKIADFAVAGVEIAPASTVVADQSLSAH